MEQYFLYVKNMFYVILSLSFIEILLPESAMNKYIKFIFSMIIMCILLQPLKLLL